eukprot:jgi/Chlat1/8976/Chrsp94S08272
MPVAIVQATLVVVTAVMSPPSPPATDRRQQHDRNQQSQRPPLLVPPATQPGPDEGKVVFVVNPKGRNGSTGSAWAKLLPQLQARLGREKVKERFTSAPKHAEEIAREAVRDGAQAVIAVGGDGTISEVVNGFFEDGKPVSKRGTSSQSTTAMGIVPMGTGSDFIKTFGWNTDAHAAIDRIVVGRRMPLDVGRIRTRGKERYFCNVASVGLSAQSAALAERWKWTGLLTYTVATLQAFTKHSNQACKIRIDDGPWQELPALTAMAIGNGKFFGGGMKITPNADPSDGSLEVVTFQDYGLVSFALRSFQLFRGTHVSARGVQVRRARKLEIARMDTDSLSPLPFLVDADGEAAGVTPATFEVIPGAIELLC